MSKDSDRRRERKRASGPSLVSLFAGAGGLDLGLELAGFTTLFANEVEEHTCRTLVENQRLSTLDARGFNEWFDSQVSTQRCYGSAQSATVAALRRRLERAMAGRRWLRHAVVACADVRSLTSEQVREATTTKTGELTLIAGGPPCQPFSRAGKRETVAVETGRLFLDFVRLVDELRPRWFLFENVKGLLLHKTDVAQVHCPTCRVAVVPPFSERAAFLGRAEEFTDCPQCKERALVEVSSPPDGSLRLILAEFERIGYKCDWRVLNAADFGAPQIRDRLFVVGSRDGESFVWPTTTHQSPASIGASSRQPSLFGGARTRFDTWRTVASALWLNGHPVFGKLNTSVARLWVKNVVRPHAEPVTWTLDRPSPTIGAHQAAKLAIAPDGVPEEQLRRQQWHVKGQRQGDLPSVYVKHEYLSDEELLSLQTFPSSWYLHGTRMQRAFQIGNAVPVRLAEVVGQSLLESCGASEQILTGATGAS